MFSLGIDLGQRRDHTAMALVEKAGSLFLLRHAERVALGTSYPRVVARIGEIARAREVYGRISLAVDATGVGAPVVDLLRGAGLGCEILAVTITGSEREMRTHGGWSVPRRDLIAGVQVLLERGELKIARRMKVTEALVRELTTVRPDGNAAGEHDDLVIALALACWRARRAGHEMNGSRRLL